MTRKVTSQVQTRSHSEQSDHQSALPTFMDHIRELQGRLFSIVLVFLIVAGAAYPFFDKIVTVLVAPLKKGQELVYLTPGGAFSFIIQVCLYIGIIGALPVIIYHIYQFVMPAVKKVKLRVVLGYTVASLVLAIVGIVFAYIVSLPAALYFLTSFDLYHINPMLTIDSYFSFVMTYLLAGAILFQLPLVMLIIDSASPLTPKKLMSYQRQMIVGSFIVAAIVSPTPDALNQTLLASPIVVMYQLGIIMIWLKNRKKNRRAVASEKTIYEEAPVVVSARPVIQTIQTIAEVKQPAVNPVTAVSNHKSIDGFGVRPHQHRATIAPPARPLPYIPRTQSRQLPSAIRPRQVSVGRSVDGFMMPIRP